MTWLVLAASALLAGVSAAGVLRPFGRGRALALEPMADPLEDERRGLLQSLRDLDQERAREELSDPSYRLLRAETEARAVAVLKALEARDHAGELAAGLGELRRRPRPGSERRGAPPRAAARRPRTLIAVVAAGVAVAVAVPLLSGALAHRGQGQPITGSFPGQAGDSDLAFFERRVAQHPDDVAARLDLAQRYLQAGNTTGAVGQYEAALAVDPRNAEALATLGYVLYRSGAPDRGLASVMEALRTDPDYPEALYFQGVILLDGLGRPAEAAAAFRAYLSAAPFGARRDEVRQLLARAESASG